MTRILAPHKEQDGWVYVRVARCEAWFARFLDLDYSPERRIISSRRVEEAVETMDYLKRCADDGLAVMWHPLSAAWYIGHGSDMWFQMSQEERDASPGCLSGYTLREAYHRYKNANASQG